MPTALSTSSSGWGPTRRRGRLPADLHVVQVGDLVHRGPDSDQVVALVDGYLTHQPDQWTQLVGNHEMQYLREPVFEWPERLHAQRSRRCVGGGSDGQHERCHRLLPRAGDDRRTPTSSPTRASPPVLAGGPRRSCGCARRSEAAAALNALWMRDRRPFPCRRHAARRRRSDVRPVGPLWASAATELLPSWLDRPLPFSQVHGHSWLFDWRRQRFRGPTEVVQRTTADEFAGHETTTLDGGAIIGVDPGHDEGARHRWRAWELSVPSAECVSTSAT